jgi:hypothetical protein
MYPMTKPVAFLALLICLPGACLFAQQKAPDAAIEEIRTAFKEINSRQHALQKTLKQRCVVINSHATIPPSTNWLIR